MSDPLALGAASGPIALRTPARDVKIGEAARAFEAHYVGQLLKTGTKPVTGEGYLDGGPAGRMYREMFYQELARIASQRGGFGVADAIERQVKQSSHTGENPIREKP